MCHEHGFSSPHHVAHEHVLGLFQPQDGIPIFSIFHEHGASRVFQPQVGSPHLVAYPKA